MSIFKQPLRKPEAVKEKLSDFSESLIMATLKQLNLKWTCSAQILWEDASTQALGNSRRSSFDSCAWQSHCLALPAAQFCLITSEEMCFICFSPVFLPTCFRELFLLSGGHYYPFPVVYTIVLLVPFFSSDNITGDISENNIYQKTEKNPKNTAKFCIPSQN